MGIKRTLDEGIFINLSPENHKRYAYGERLTSSAVEASLHVNYPSVTSPGQVKSNSNEEVPYIYDHKDDTFNPDKELESSLPISAVTSISSDEDAGNGDTSFWHGHNIDFRTPIHRVERSKDPYRYFLDQSPVKEIPVGLDYQAKIPPWNPNSRAEYFSASNHLLGGNRDQELMGNCIINPSSYSDDFIVDGLRIGRGRTHCHCFDVGSMRCTQQHIREARENLRENVGDKAFAELGFYDMGEIVARNWTTDEEQLFHEIIFSNPPSMSRKFWRHLRFAFPRRSMMELVSYYFNVFMLRRRAFQNRSYLLEIDSDDDEEHKDDDDDEEHKDDDDDDGDVCEKISNPLDGDGDDNVEEDDRMCGEGLCCIVKGSEEDSTIESLDDQDLDSCWVDDFWPEPDGAGPGFNDGKNPSSPG